MWYLNTEGQIMHFGPKAKNLNETFSRCKNQIHTHNLDREAKVIAAMRAFASASR